MHVSGFRAEINAAWIPDRVRDDRLFLIGKK